jgi:predicted ATPase
MTPTPTHRPPPARIEYLKEPNLRALREVEFKDLTPLTVLLGPNGSGKSTVFDVSPTCRLTAQEDSRRLGRRSA